MKVLLVPDSLQWVLGQWASQVVACEPRHTYYLYTDRLNNAFPEVWPALAGRVDAVHLLSPRQWGRTPVPGDKASVVSVNHVTDWDSVSAALSADVICCMSAEWRRILEGRGIPPGKLADISHGAGERFLSARATREQARKRLGLPQGQFLVGCFASATSNEDGRKGMDILGRALELLNRERPGCGLVLTGAGWNAWSRPLQDQGVAVHAFPFLHERSMPLAYRALNAYVIPSRVEGGPVPLLEAMACAVPPIATAVGFVPEEVRNGENGFVVPVGDARAIADCVTRLRNEASLAEHLGAAARRDMVRRRRWPDVLRGVGEVYETAVRRHGRRAGRGGVGAGKRLPGSGVPAGLLSPRPDVQRRAAKRADAGLWRDQLVQAGHRRAALSLALRAVAAWPLDRKAWGQCRRLLSRSR